MKGKINEGGFLEILRKNKYIAVVCPYQRGYMCGNWCALFEEPFRSTNQKPGEYSLFLCKDKHLLLEDFKDERK